MPVSSGIPAFYLAKVSRQAVTRQPWQAALQRTGTQIGTWRQFFIAPSGFIS